MSRSLYKSARRIWLRRKVSSKRLEHSQIDGNQNGRDSCPDHEQVSLWMWLPGLLATLVMACIVLRFRFSMPLPEILLAMFLAFFFSFLAIQSTGATGVIKLSDD
jgi:hypothetical protein